MTDSLSPARRSWNMSQIRSKDTKPEVAVRSILHRNGFRFRLHSRVLPGRPDIVLRRFRSVVFVHGCFWHRHKGCSNSTLPSTNRSAWRKKFEQNVDRDRRNITALRELGWRVFVVWECEVPGGRSASRMLKELTELQEAESLSRRLFNVTNCDCHAARE